MVPVVGEPASGSHDGMVRIRVPKRLSGVVLLNSNYPHHLLLLPLRRLHWDAARQPLFSRRYDENRVRTGAYRRLTTEEKEIDVRATPVPPLTRCNVWRTAQRVTPALVYWCVARAMTGDSASLTRLALVVGFCIPTPHPL
jgi:hypothetical protein